MAKGKPKGKFISIEGVDGSGKTTQAKKLVKSLQQQAFDAIYTTEPSRGNVGRLIRSFVLNREQRVPIAQEALLFAADRVDHVETEIKPQLERGKIVVCDRYVYSSLAYQGAAGLDLDWIDGINRFALKPDLALLLDVSLDVAVSRLKGQKSVMENMSNLRKVRDVYLKLARQRRMVLLDGNKSIEDLAESILRIFLKELKP